MSRKIKLLTVAACLCLSAISISTLAVLSTPASAPLPIPSASAELPAAHDNDEFLVTILDGYVAVYLSDKPLEPVETTEIRAEALRLADQEMLRRGVLLQGMENLSVFLEDFGP